jgi:hypothetical protein
MRALDVMSLPIDKSEAPIQRTGGADTARRYGPQIVDNGVSFNLWAPSARTVELMEVGQPPHRMSCDDDGWYQAFSPTAHPGSQAMQAACAMARDLFVNGEAQRLVVDLRQEGGSPVVKIIISLGVEEP